MSQRSDTTSRRPHSAPEVGASCSTASLTTILGRVADGDASAKDALWHRVYEELHDRARHILWRRNASLRPTEMVQEVFLKFESQRKTPLNRTHFRAVAARLMYRVLLDHLESRGRRERARVTLHEEELPASSAFDVDALALRQAMERLEADEPRLAAIVVYRFFGDLTMAEIAEELELTERHVYRLWRFARARLLSELES